MGGAGGKRKAGAEPSRPASLREHEWPLKPQFRRMLKRAIPRWQTIKSSLSRAELKAAVGPKPKPLAEDVIAGYTKVTTSTKILSSDGYPLLYFNKGGLEHAFDPDEGRSAGHAGLGAANQLIANFPPKFETKTVNGKKHIDSRGYFPVEEGRGVYHFAGWQATGHESSKAAKSRVDKDACLSGHILGDGSSKRTKYSFSFLKAITPVTQAIGAMFEAIDPEAYTRYKALFDRLDNTELSQGDFLGHTSRACFMGIVLLAGLSCAPHRDVRDTMDGWVADTAYGDFDGGNLYLPQLGIQIELRQGDVMFMRSAMLEHGVAGVSRGFRYGCVYFTHGKMFH